MIELVSTIQVPTDYTLAVSNEVSASVSFTVVVEATCDVSHFVDWSLLTNTEYQHFVKAEPSHYSIGPVEDTVSRINGD